MSRVKNRPASMQDVAELAGVSDVTVSRAFSGTAPVAKATLKKIMDASKTLDYRPSALARGLRGAKTMTIGISWSLGYEMTQTARAVAIGMKSRGYYSYIVDNLGEIELIMDSLREFAHRRVDAVVLRLREDVEQEAEVRELLSKFPAVVAVSEKFFDVGVDQVIWDQTDSVRQVVDHFAACGRQKIGYLGSRMDRKSQCFEEQTAAQGIHGLVIKAKHFLPVGGKIDANGIGDELNEYFANRPFDLDAMVCGSDSVAVAAMAWLKARGLRVPEDVALVGRDNTDIAPHLDPKLASVERRNVEVADMVDQMLMDRLNKQRTGAPRTERVPMTFVWRESAGKRK